MEDRAYYRVSYCMAKERLTVTIEPEIYEWLKTESEKELRTVSNFVEYVLYQAMQENKASKKQK